MFLLMSILNWAWRLVLLPLTCSVSSFSLKTTSMRNPCPPLSCLTLISLCTFLLFNKKKKIIRFHLIHLQGGSWEEWETSSPQHRINIQFLQHPQAIISYITTPHPTSSSMLPLLYNRALQSSSYVSYRLNISP